MTIPNPKQFAAVCLLALAATAQSASALAEDTYEAPAKGHSTPWWCILYTAVFLLAAVVVAFKNSGRTHLD